MVSMFKGTLGIALSARLWDGSGPLWSILLPPCAAELWGTLVCAVGAA